MRKPYIYRSKGLWWCLWGYFKGTGPTPSDAYTAAGLCRDHFWSNH